jgi:hypothetical protein
MWAEARLDGTTGPVDWPARPVWLDERATRPAPGQPARRRLDDAAAPEWYDFFIYGTLVFGRLFFPQADPAAATLDRVRHLRVGFVFRPLGGIVFGHIGARIGRRATLILTTLVMGPPPA